MEELQNARKAAELTSIPVEHLLLAQIHYHALSVSDPSDPLRPSHFGMLQQSVGSLGGIVLSGGPDDDEDDYLPPAPDRPEEEDVAAPSITGVGALDWVRAKFGRK